MPYATTTDNVRIFYERIGAGRPVVIFLHGWGGAGSGHSWKGLLPYLDLTDLSLILLDLRGHGRSDRPASEFTLESATEDVWAVAREVHADTLILVAFSMGGKLAQWISCTAPDRIIGQVLIAPVPAIAMPIPDGIIQEWMGAIRRRDHNRFGELLGSMTSKPLPESTADDFLRDAVAASDKCLLESLAMSSDRCFAERLGATTAKTLALAGTSDPYGLTTLLPESLLTHISGARLEALDCGHYLPLEKPAETAALTNSFLDGFRQAP
jgi:pimeloyl-ACP methyl ester carboxylesterase